MRLKLALLFALVLTIPAPAHDFVGGSLAIGHPWIRMPPPGAKTAGGYLTIHNDAGEPNALLGAEAMLSASATLHETTNIDGISRMRELASGVKIEAKGTAILAPGGVHIMFTDLKRKLTVGDMIPVVLLFANGERVMVSFKVEPIGFAPSEKAAQRHDGHQQ